MKKHHEDRSGEIQTSKVTLMITAMLCAFFFAWLADMVGGSRVEGVSQRTLEIFERGCDVPACRVVGVQGKTLTGRA